jgi:hypothetical protein
VAARIKTNSGRRVIFVRIGFESHSRGTSALRGPRDIAPHRIAAAFHSQLAALSRHQEHRRPKATSNVVGMGAPAPGEPA